jgi:ubiquinol-cytochrome c reductase cytochrome b subunit
LLPWGQMSYWGAQVIVNLFATIPFIGPDVAEWLRGDYLVSDATLNRFFAFHVIALPLVLLGLVAAHIIALHEVGSNNPDGIEIKKNKDPQTGIPLDGIPFHPYYTVKDIVGVTVFLIVFSAIVFFAPEMGGYFLEANNFVPADPLKTPAHIAPVWYFTPYYSILRAVPPLFNSQFPGVVAMGAAVVVFAALPWLDKSPVKSIRYRGAQYKSWLAAFVLSFLILGYLGTVPSNIWGQFGAGLPLVGGADRATVVARVLTVVYFLFFALMPWYTKRDKTKPVPERVTG